MQKNFNNFISNNSNSLNPRIGCQDMWNAFMVKDAKFSLTTDIPFCPCISHELPIKLISYDDAKSLCKKETKKGNINFKINAYVHFYIDDQKFDGKHSSIWLYPYKALNVIKHFAGIISPDFSTNCDFPDPWKRFNTYRMRAFGYWISSQGIPVINNVRWGTIETWNYCFDGIPQNSIVAVGTVASGINRIENRPLFEFGLKKMVEILSPYAIIIYGSANYPFIQELEEIGITIVSFPSKTSEAFKRRKNDEQSK